MKKLTEKAAADIQVQMEAYDFDKEFAEAVKNHKANQKKTLAEASANELMEAMIEKFKELEKIQAIWPTAPATDKALF